MAETLGSLIDKICIMDLKVFYTTKQTQRTDVAPDHIRMCEERLAILSRQRNDLVAELDETIRAWREGRWVPKVYRQFKMYNDPRFRIPAAHAK